MCKKERVTEGGSYTNLQQAGRERERERGSPLGTFGRGISLGGWYHIPFFTEASELNSGRMNICGIQRLSDGK